MRLLGRGRNFELSKWKTLTHALICHSGRCGNGNAELRGGEISHGPVLVGMLMKQWFSFWFWARMCEGGNAARIGAPCKERSQSRRWKSTLC